MDFGGETCPFCHMPIDDPGEAFMTHLAQHPSCKAEWAVWSERVVEDSPL